MCYICIGRIEELCCYFIFQTYHTINYTMDSYLPPYMGALIQLVKSEFLVVKVARQSESIVLVVKLKKPSEDTDTGLENIQLKNVSERPSLPRSMVSLVLASHGWTSKGAGLQPDESESCSSIDQMTRTARE